MGIIEKLKNLKQSTIYGLMYNGNIVAYRLKYYDITAKKFLYYDISDALIKDTGIYTRLKNEKLQHLQLYERGTLLVTQSELDNKILIDSSLSQAEAIVLVSGILSIMHESR